MLQCHQGPRPAAGLLSHMLLAVEASIGVFAVALTVFLEGHPRSGL